MCIFTTAVPQKHFQFIIQKPSICANKITWFNKENCSQKSCKWFFEVVNLKVDLKGVNQAIIHLILNNVYLY